MDNNKITRYELSKKSQIDYQTIDNYYKNKLIKEAFSKLTNRERTIIYSRYYLDKTQMEIASELDISQAQVSRLEKSALKTMHDAMKS